MIGREEEGRVGGGSRHHFNHRPRDLGDMYYPGVRELLRVANSVTGGRRTENTQAGHWSAQHSLNQTNDCVCPEA